MSCIVENETDQQIKAWSLEAHLLPFEVREKLYDFKVSGNNEGYLLFQNLDISQPERWLTTYGSLLGEPYSYIQEGDGKLYHDITPRQGYETRISSKSSNVNLDFHTELVFHHFIPDYLLLFCIRGDRDNQAATYVSSIQNSFHELSEALKEVLFQPLFLTGIDHSFGNTTTEKGNGKPVSILYGDPSNPLLNFDPDLMVGKTDIANMALAELKNILFKNKHTLLLQAGDFALIDNRRAVHGRSLFKAYYDGKDRYLKRLFITKDLSRAEEIFSKKERIITYSFDKQPCR